MTPDRFAVAQVKRLTDAFARSAKYDIIIGEGTDWGLAVGSLLGS